jgi:hypothetical protein
MKPNLATCSDEEFSAYEQECRYDAVERRLFRKFVSLLLFILAAECLAAVALVLVIFFK